MWNPFKNKAQPEADYSTLEPNQSLVSINENDNRETLQPVSENVNSNSLGTTMNTQMKVAELGAGLAHQAIDVYKTSLMVEQNIAAIQSASKVQLAQIASKYEFCKTALEHVFQDRHSALAAHYCVLNDAMKSNDREMILGALRGISSIVVTSPLKDFTEIVNNWDSYSKKKPLELDF